VCGLGTHAGAALPPMYGTQRAVRVILFMILFNRRLILFMKRGGVCLDIMSSYYYVDCGLKGPRERVAGTSAARERANWRDVVVMLFLNPPAGGKASERAKRVSELTLWQ
jgi:hypothetical protein